MSSVNSQYQFDLHNILFHGVKPSKEWLEKANIKHC